jgi:hypothetical protein
VAPLIDIGRRSPALGAALGSDRPTELAALRLLWSLRATMPWSAHGEATTAFDLAVSPQLSGRHLRRDRDVLLTIDDLPGGALVADGVVVAGKRFTALPASFEVRPRADVDEYALFIGHSLIPFVEDPSPLLPVLEGWFRYFFVEFQPRIAEVYQWQAPGSLTFGSGQRIACPGCRQPVTPRRAALAASV